MPRRRVSFVVALSARQRDIGPVLGAPRETVARLVSEAGRGGALVFGNETVG